MWTRYVSVLCYYPDNPKYARLHAQVGVARVRMVRAKCSPVEIAHAKFPKLLPKPNPNPNPNRSQIAQRILLIVQTQIARNMDLLCIYAGKIVRAKFYMLHLVEYCLLYTTSHTVPTALH